MTELKSFVRNTRSNRFLPLVLSVIRDDFKDDSDIDFVVDFDETDPFKYTDLYFQLKENLEKLLQRQIDLIEERGIKNQFFRKELDSTKILIYGQ
ncbi:MAG: nucleotidyltransferase domain-containing protein [Flavobacteriaceae bacterium]|nr:nucleotidyltransferase domain-containing protein [Flavobacteriaceae bacterium]